jgi:DNA-binding CsgD family transcriptional regulator
VRNSNNVPSLKSQNDKVFLDYHARLSPKLQEICSPLFEFLSLDSFSYSRIQSDGRFLYLSTHQNWLQTFYEKELYNTIEFQKDHYYLENNEEEGAFLTMGVPNDNEFLKHLYSTRIWNSLTLFLKSLDLTECWTFSSTPNVPKVLNLYINRPDIFKHFSTYFNRELQGVLDLENQDIYGELMFACSELCTLSKVNKEISHPFEIQKFYLSGERDDIYLSKRETECLFYLSKGNTVKEIGKSLSISPRTVEVYIENAKMKTQLKSKVELLNMFEEEGFKDALLYSQT